MTQSTPAILVRIDLYTTRRKKVHEVTNASEEAIFYAETLGDLLRWLHENDHTDFEVIDETSRFRIALSVPTPPTS